MIDIRGRHIKTILYLLEQRYPVSTSKISKEIDVNINTLRKDIPWLKKFLRKNGLSLITKPRIGLKIDSPYERIESFKEELTFLGNGVLDRKGKLWYIAEIFLSKEEIPTIEDLSVSLGISRPTITKYIREVKDWLSKKGIAVFGKPGFGYYIKGDEEDIRDAIIDSIKNFLEFEFQTVALEFAQGNLEHNLLGVFENTNIDTIKEFIDKVQTHIKKRFVDEDLLNLAIFIAVSIERIKRKHRINLETKKVAGILENPMSLTIKDNIYDLEQQFEVRFTGEEISYLALKFMGARTEDIEDTRGLIMTSEFKKIAEEIASLTDELLGFPMNKEDESILALARHLESTITKIKMGVKIQNSSLQMVKKEYPIVYSIAERASKMIESKLSMKVPDEETGYIAMYIAISLEKMEQPRKRKVAVICSMGVATSRLLCYKLSNEIPEIEIVQFASTRKLEEGDISQKIDLIVSTVPLSGVKIPCALVSPFLRPEDKKAIKEILKLGKRYLLREIDDTIFDDRLILPEIITNSSREVIELLGNALIKNGFAREGLVKEVLSREKKFPTGINTEIPIAIPHSGPEFVIKKGLAIATLKHSVKFGEMSNPEKVLDVRIIVMPVFTGKEEHEKEFYEFVQRLGDKEMVSELLDCHSAQTVKRICMKSQFHT